MALNLSGMARMVGRSLPTDIFSRLGLNKTIAEYDTSGEPGKTPQKLQDFITAVSSRGLARPTWYYVIIHTPAGNGNERLASLFCSAAEFPAVNINSQGSLIQGFSTEMPYGVSFPDVTMTFYLDSDFIVKSFFDKWVMSSVVDRGNTYEVEYWSNFVSDISICQIDAETNDIYTVVLKNAWPKAVSGIQVSADSSGLSSLQVSFTYEKWIVTKESESDFLRKVGTLSQYSKGIAGMFESFKGLLSTPMKFVSEAKSTISKITNIFSF